MRGKVSLPVLVLSDNRITPAHAGKSSMISLKKLHQRDHPRTCGEKKLIGGDDVVSVGSPPHMRGKVF